MAVDKKSATPRRAATRTRDSNGANGKLVLRGEKPETLLVYYREMVLIRRFEQRAGEMYTQVLTPGWLIEVRSGGRVLEYHTDASDRFVLCNPGS